MEQSDFYEHSHRHKQHRYKELWDECVHPHCHLVNATLLIMFWFSSWTFLEYLMFFVFKLLKIKSHGIKLFIFATMAVVTIAIAVIHNKSFNFIPQYGF